MKPLYKTASTEKRIHNLYDQKLASLNIDYTAHYYDTSYGSTHVIECGKPDGPAVVVIHGVNAGAPVAIEPIIGLLDRYRLYAIDVVGQTTRSASTRMSTKDDSLGRWLKEVVDQLGINAAPFIGISYGAMILQKLLIYQSEMVSKVIFIVPSGLVDGSKGRGLTQLMWPLLKFKITKSEKHLHQFMSAFYADADQHMYDLNRINLTEVNLDLKTPPLLKDGSMDHIKQPVYAMAADDDIFFPGRQAIERCGELFINFKGHHVLTGSKHIPQRDSYHEIEGVLGEWLRD